MNNNIVLIGVPWAGKTTLWKQLAAYTSLPFFDTDDDWEQQTWILVSDRLSQEWEASFKQQEEAWICSLDIQHSIISCSWSIPLYEKAMHHLSQDSTIIWIAPDIEIILSRLVSMKIERIIWMNKNNTLQNVLEKRKAKYEYRWRNKFVIHKDTTQSDIFKLFLSYLKRKWFLNF